MKKNGFMRKLLTAFLTIILFVQSVTAQATNGNADTGSPSVMEQNGKIYVVLAVCLLIFSGILFFLFRIEKRISEIEKRNQ